MASIVNTLVGRSSADGSRNYAGAEDRKLLTDPEGCLFVRPISFSPDGLNQQVQVASGAAYVSYYVVTPGIPSGLSIESLVGFNAHPTDPLFLLLIPQLVAGAPTALAPADITIPVAAAYGTFSFSVPFNFPDLLNIALSTTPLVYTDPGAPYLSFALVYREAAP